MIDLEKLIRDKQDQLRGRPRDWIDDVAEWLAMRDIWLVAFFIVTLILIIYLGIVLTE